MVTLSPYLMISATIFLVVAIAHLTRLIGGWPIEIAGLVVPVWVSLPGVLFAGALAIWGMTLALSIE